jgi:arylsulfatase A-like enzyme
MAMNRPNIVFVLTDDQGYGDLGCTGNPILRTPNLDRFHDESVRLTNFHVGAVCAPTRAGLMTGHYPNSTGVWHTVAGRSILRRDEYTLAEALREAGYRTGMFGKWHLGDAYPYRPCDRGFEVAVFHGGGGISQTPDYWGNDYFDDTFSVNGTPQAFQGYCTDVFFAQALEFIRQNRDRPFFCYIPTNAPHAPYNVPPHYRAPYEGQVPDQRARFYGMISCIDENFGVLLQRLREWGLEENTILIFMTDNGTSGGATVDRRGFVVDGYNAGMRGVKGWQYEGGHRVPCFIRWPRGGLLHGQDISELAAHVDLMPTLLDLCGVEPAAERTFHGCSLAPLLRGATEWPDRTLVTDMQWVANPEKWRKCAVMTRRWRLIDGRELYDMSVDAGQQADVAAQHPDVVAQLRAEYEKWWDLVSRRFGEPIPAVLGAPGAPETRLTCHDWRAEVQQIPWNQGHIREALEANGPWEVRVETAGRYRIELRRWPREANRALNAGIEGDDIEWRREWISERDWPWYEGGRAVTVREARLRVGDQEWITSVAAEDLCATFEVELPAGQTMLQTWLSDGAGHAIGAYFVYVKKL